MSDLVKVEKYMIDQIRKAAKEQEAHALEMLQSAVFTQDQLMLMQAIETWQAVQRLIEQRDKLQKYVRLLVISEAEPDTVTAAKDYLAAIGVSLEGG